MEPLNGSQRRYLASVLANVDAYLKAIGDLIQEDIQPVERARLQSFTAAFRAQAEELKKQFGLPDPEAIVRRWSIHTHLEFMNVELMELTHAKLSGYGYLGDDTFLLLNDRIDQLMTLIREQLTALR